MPQSFEKFWQQDEKLSDRKERKKINKIKTKPSLSAKMLRLLKSKEIYFQEKNFHYFFVNVKNKVSKFIHSDSFTDISIHAWIKHPSLYFPCV